MALNRSAFLMAVHGRLARSAQELDKVTFSVDAEGVNSAALPSR